MIPPEKSITLRERHPDKRKKPSAEEERKRGRRASQIGKGKSGSLCFAFHLHDWPYRPIGLGAEPVA